MRSSTRTRDKRAPHGVGDEPRRGRVNANAARVRQRTSDEGGGEGERGRGRTKEEGEKRGKSSARKAPCVYRAGRGKGGCGLGCGWTPCRRGDSYHARECEEGVEWGVWMFSL